MGEVNIDEVQERFLRGIGKFIPATREANVKEPPAKAHGAESAMSDAAADDPEPISLETIEAPPFPTNLIPATWLRDAVESVALATETPVELAIFLSLAVAATAVQRRYAIEVERGYLERLCLWLSAALESGGRKTPVLKEMTLPLLEYERRQAAAMARDMAQAEAAKRLAEDRIKHLRHKAARAAGGDLDKLKEELLIAEASVPEVPREVRLWAQDVTPERLGQLMAEHDHAMSILSDEGGIFDIMGGRYNAGIPNLDLFLQSFSAAPVRVDRGSRPAVFMPAPVLTMGLTPQPSVLTNLAQQFRGRGIWARFLYALPRNTLGFRTLEERPIPDAIRANYVAGITAMLILPPREDGRPHRLSLTSDAHAAWKAFQRHVEEEMRPGGRFEHMKDWASKLPGNAARVAGVWHCAEFATDEPERHPVSLETMRAALAFANILEGHAVATFQLMAVDGHLESARRVWAWIQQQRLAKFSRRDVFQKLKGTFHDIESLRPALAVLEERGYIFPDVPSEKEKKPGRPSHKYRVNTRLSKEWQL